ncbi:MAG: hypothetical protein IPN01_19380 [Deltaproteobacteria bacterium]|nr:hypothetical protein [Deltaproteobacteria bacterium]
MSTATRTVMFSDLVGYTARSINSKREEQRQLVIAHERLVEPQVLAHGGRVVNRMGDGLLLCFDSATEAALAGQAILEQVALEDELELRLAAATGDVEEIGEDVLGDIVNLAARVNAEGKPGELWITDVTRQCLNQREIAWEPLDALALKGIPGMVAVCRVVPRHRCHLPLVISSAQRSAHLLRLRHNVPVSVIPADPIVLLEGFAPGSPELQRAVDAVPVMDPARVWLNAYQLSPATRLEWLGRGHNLLISTPEALDRALGAIVPQPPTDPAQPSTQSFEAEDALTLAGLALPAVPFSNIIAAYSFDLLSDSRWVSRDNGAVARVEVRVEGVSVLALAAGVSVNGQPLRAGERRPLNHGAIMRTSTSDHRFSSLASGPYRGLLVNLSPADLLVSLKQAVELGRDPQGHGFSVHDRRGEENLTWCPGPRAARAREEGFNLDRSLISRRHARLTPDREGQLRLTSLSERSPTYLHSDRRGLERVVGEATAHDDDLIVLGTHVIGVRRGAGAMS